jgi:hypothetical protein
MARGLKIKACFWDCALYAPGERSKAAMLPTTRRGPLGPRTSWWGAPRRVPHPVDPTTRQDSDQELARALWERRPGEPGPGLRPREKAPWRHDPTMLRLVREYVIAEKTGKPVVSQLEFSRRLQALLPDLSPSLASIVVWVGRQRKALLLELSDL